MKLTRRGTPQEALKPSSLAKRDRLYDISD